MQTSDWISLLALVVSIVALAVSLAGHRARPRVSISQDLGETTDGHHYVVRVDNAGLDAI